MEATESEAGEDTYANYGSEAGAGGDESVLLYCIVAKHLYSASCSEHQSEALPMRETQREESRLEKTKNRHLARYS